MLLELREQAEAKGIAFKLMNVNQNGGASAGSYAPGLCFRSHYRSGVFSSFATPAGAGDAASVVCLIEFCDEVIPQP